MEMISIYHLRFSVGDRIIFFLEPSMQNIPSEEVYNLFVQLLLSPLCSYLMMKVYSLHWMR